LTEWAIYGTIWTINSPLWHTKEDFMENYEAEFADLEEAKKQARKLEEAKKCKTATILLVVGNAIYMLIGILGIFLPMKVGGQGALISWAFAMSKLDGTGFTPIPAVYAFIAFTAIAMFGVSSWELMASVRLLRNKKTDAVEYYEIYGGVGRGPVISLGFFIGVLLFVLLGVNGLLGAGFWFLLALSLSVDIFFLVPQVMISNLIKERKEREKYNVQ